MKEGSIEELALVIERSPEGIIKWQLRRGGGAVLRTSFLPPGGTVRFTTAPDEAIVVNGCLVHFNWHGLEIDDWRGRNA
jgi:hypothetical protein